MGVHEWARRAKWALKPPPGEQRPRASPLRRASPVWRSPSTSSAAASPSTSSASQPHSPRPTSPYSGHAPRRPSDELRRRLAAAAAAAAALPDAGAPKALWARLRKLPARPFFASLEGMVANYSNLFTRNAEDVSNGVANWEAAVRLRLDDVLAPPKAHVSTLRSFKWEERFVLWAATTDLQIRGLPGFDVAIVYDEIFEMKGLAVPSRDDEKARMLDDFPAGSLLEPANKLRLKNPTRWGKRFAKKWEAIPCLADASSEFDVVAFYSEHAEVSRLETVPWTQPDVWILSPTELQARGHFPNIFAGLSAANDPRESSESSDSRAAEYLETLRILSALLTLDDQDARKRHLVRHHAAWDHASNGCCLGEVLRCNTSEIASELAPSELVDALRERARQDIKPDVRYDLDDLPDTADLVVLRSKRELDAAGRALDTCALSHADAVEKGDCVLLVLRSDKGAPFAIGDFRTKAGQWVSIREARGGTPNAETRAAFTGTTAKMRAWAEGAARKRKRREEYQAPTIYFRPRIR